VFAHITQVTGSGGVGSFKTTEIIGSNVNTNNCVFGDIAISPKTTNGIVIVACQETTTGEETSTTDIRAYRNKNPFGSTDNTFTSITTLSTTHMGWYENISKAQDQIPINASIGLSFDRADSRDWAPSGNSLEFQSFPLQ